MKVSTFPVMRYFVATLFAILVVVVAGPALASANTLGGGSSVESSLVKHNDAARLTAVDDVKRCMDTDASKGDHHDKESWESQAKDWEAGARKHAAAKRHKEAAAAYEYAACLRLKAVQYEKAASDYDKAAEQWDKAGDKAKADEARKAAKAIRDSMK